MSTPTPAPTIVQPPSPRLAARGKVVPVHQSRVGTLTGGVVTRVAVEVGDSVDEQHELARVRTATGTEVLTAPRAGTVTDIVVHLGDTVMPGTTLVTVADLSRLQIETTDVDEFLIPFVQRGQLTTVTIDALEGIELPGEVRSVSLEPRTTTAGDEHYPTTIDLGVPSSTLRPGMSVRVEFVAAQ
jgi:multidrug efflux pump subunit AcrA (membrane-fusion protein)